MISSPTLRSDPALPTRYHLLFPLASGGTASVHLGCLRGIAGFWRLVAIKVAHAASFHPMMVEEAALASKIHHPNVVPVIDIADSAGKLLLVMDYIEGGSIHDLTGTDEPLPPRVAIHIALDACAGLHAAHSLADAAGRSFNLVHRDVSPHNILVGTDGVARITDFGIAKTAFCKGRSAVGTLKGKLAYMAPEYISGNPANAASDVFGLAVVIWEMLAGRRLFRGRNAQDTLKNVVKTEAPRLSSVAPHLGTALDAVLEKALSKSPERRYSSARELGLALEAAASRADLVGTASEVGAVVLARTGERLAERRRQLAAALAEEPSSDSRPLPPAPAARDQVTRPERVMPATSPVIVEAPEPRARVIEAARRAPAASPGAAAEVSAASIVLPLLTKKPHAHHRGPGAKQSSPIRALALVLALGLGTAVELIVSPEPSSAAAPGSTPAFSKKGSSDVHGRK